MAAFKTRLKVCLTANQCNGASLEIAFKIKNVLYNEIKKKSFVKKIKSKGKNIIFQKIIFRICHTHTYFLTHSCFSFHRIKINIDNRWEAESISTVTIPNKHSKLHVLILKKNNNK